MPTSSSLVPLVPKREDEYLAELAEVSKQVSLGVDSLPSICCYTLYNTATAGVTSVELSRNATIVSAAFDDSTIRVWDMYVVAWAQQSVYTTYMVSITWLVGAGAKRPRATPMAGVGQLLSPWCYVVMLDPSTRPPAAQTTRTCSQHPRTALFDCGICRCAARTWLAIEATSFLYVSWAPAVPNN